MLISINTWCKYLFKNVLWNEPFAFENILFVFRDDSVYGGEENELVWVNEKSIPRERYNVSSSRKVVVRNYY